MQLMIQKKVKHLGSVKSHQKYGNIEEQKMFKQHRLVFSLWERKVYFRIGEMIVLSPYSGVVAREIVETTKEYPCSLLLKRYSHALC